MYSSKHLFEFYFPRGIRDIIQQVMTRQPRQYLGSRKLKSLGNLEGTQSQYA